MDYVKKTKTIHVGAIAADSDASLWALWKLANAIKIVAIRLGVNADNTKADTNYNTVQVKNGSSVVAAIANGPNGSTGTSITKGTFADMALTAANCSPAAGDTLSLKVTKTGSGLAYAGAVIEIDYYDYNA